MINYLYASDDNFAKVLGVSLLSLCMSNNENIGNIFIISQGISDINKNKLKIIANKYNKELTFLEMPNFDKIIGEKVDIKRYSASMFSRIIIDRLLPKNIDRIIYLDCDTMIRRDLTGLWDANLKGKTLGAIDDFRSIYYQRNLGINDKNRYINSGVLLIDVNMYRKNKYESKLIEAIKKYNGLLEFPDNDAICKVLEDDITLLPLRYNITSVFYMTTPNELIKLRKPVNKVTTQYIEREKDNAAITHFTTCFLMKGRPWLKGCTHPETSAYLKLYNETPWRDEDMADEKLNIKKKIFPLLILLNLNLKNPLKLRFPI